MNYFILEDNKMRQQWFKENLKGHRITIVDNVDDAKRILKTSAYDIIFLDHDLGEGTGGESYYNSGVTIAEFIPKTPNKDTEIYIHSQNPVGAENMQKILNYNGINSTIIPFGSFKLN